MANVKATDLIDFTRASKGHALAKVSYGSELVENGTFDSDTTGWTANQAIISSESGRLKVVDSGAFSGAKQAISTKAGSVYVIQFDYDNNAVGVDNAYVALHNGDKTGTTITTGSNGDVLNFNDSYAYISGDTGTAYILFVALSSTTTILIGSSSTYTAYHDNVSVKEVLFDQPDGTLQLFEHPVGIPRIEYDADGNLLGLLIEESRTNLLTYSEDLTPLTKVNSPTITTDIATAPDGTETVDGIQDASGGAFKRVKMFQGSVTANSTHTGSLFVKKELTETNYGGITLSFTGGTSKVCYGIIDAVNGTIYAPSNNTITATFTTTEVGDFWRFSITATDTGSNTQLEFGVYGTLSTDGTTVGSGAGSVRRIWGFQLEAGAFPTSYIKSNSGSTTTRSADVASIPVSDFGYNQSEGTVVVESSIISPQTAQYNAFVQLVEDTNNRIDLGVLVNDGWQSVRTGGVDTAKYYTDGHNANIFDAGEVAVTALAFSPNSTNSAANGSLGTEDTSSALPTAITTLKIGVDHTSRYTNGHIKSIKYIPKRLSNAKLQELTS